MMKHPIFFLVAAPSRGWMGCSFYNMCKYATAETEMLCLLSLCLLSRGVAGDRGSRARASTRAIVGGCLHLHFAAEYR